MDKNSICNNALKIITDPVHGIEYYSKKEFNELINELFILNNSLEIDNSTKDKDKINIITNYIKHNVSIRSDYFKAFTEELDEFPNTELIYRTSYGALIKKEAMCAGFAELTRILLSINNIQSQTLLSKLPGKNKKLIHYVVLAKYKENNNDNFIILDPERQANCEKTGKNFDLYQENMLYLPVKQLFIKNKVGSTGVGLEVNDYINYLDKENIEYINGKKNINRLWKNIDKEIEGRC